MANEELKDTVQELEEEILDEEYEYEYEDEGPRGPSGLSLALNRYFHHLDRGGTLGGEILAGITMFFVSICVLFMNVQLVAQSIGISGELVNAPGVQENIEAAHLYTDLYAGSLMICIIGTLLMGLVARLPFTQVSLMNLAGGLLNLVLIKSGLSWQNLLLINLIAGVIYAVICCVPKLRQWVWEGITAPVRKALPAALGLCVGWYALQQTGIFAVSETGSITGFALRDMRALKLWGLIGAAVALAMFALLSALKRKHKVFWSLMGGTVVFAGAMVLLNGTDTSNTESFINFGRIWLIAGSQASPTTPFADSYLTYAMDSIKAVFENMGQVFTKGMDFSAYTGNTLLTVIGGVLMFVFTGLFSTQGALGAAQEQINGDAEEGSAVELDTHQGMGKAAACNAITNVLAPFFGVAGMSCGVSSVSATKDHGKSGIASIVACIGFVISLFVMAFPALFATETYPVISMNQWNYFAYGNSGIVYLMSGAVFAIVDVVLVCLGVSMAASLKKLNWRSVGEWLSAIACVLVAILSGNLVAGALCGSLIWLVISLISDRKAIKISTIALTVLMAVAVVLI